jgi:hypothetical protein
LSSTTISYGGVNYVAPIGINKAPGTTLNISAIKSGYTTENKFLNVYDATGLATQKVVFLMSATLVSLYTFWNIQIRQSKF